MGSRRTAAHCEKRWRAWLRIEQLRSFKRSEEAKALTLTVKSLISRSREEKNTKYLQLVEQCCAPAAPSSALPLTDMCGCILRRMRAPPRGMMENWVGEERKRGGC